ncbi:MAG: DoxX family protein [Bacteroidetes bacterium RIFCSPLOWO2_12_FULL_31_6]|nr:MAG: DoxX family protein [Bacteroidetes bacterium RIFCSPLOWO2_12_FULL_31_6]
MKLILLCLMALMYVAAGIYHFVNPKLYMKIMPPYLPYHLQLIYISGVIEIVLGILLIPESTRTIAAWLIIALLIAVFPANIQMAINFWQKNSSSLWIAIARLPLQVVLIWLAWLFTKK